MEPPQLLRSWIWEPNWAKQQSKQLPWKGLVQCGCATCFLEKANVLTWPFCNIQIQTQTLNVSHKATSAVPPTSIKVSFILPVAQSKQTWCHPWFLIFSCNSLLVHQQILLALLSKHIQNMTTSPHPFCHTLVQVLIMLCSDYPKSCLAGLCRFLLQSTFSYSSAPNLHGLPSHSG